MMKIMEKLFCIHKNTKKYEKRTKKQRFGNIASV